MLMGPCKQIIGLDVIGKILLMAIEQHMYIKLSPIQKNPNLQAKVMIGLFSDSVPYEVAVEELCQVRENHLCLDFRLQVFSPKVCDVGV